LVDFNPILYYLCADTTATKPITQTAQEQEDMQMQATKENTWKGGNENHI